MIISGYCSYSLYIVGEVLNDIIILYISLISGHSGSSCSFHNYFRYIDFSFLKVLMLVPVRLWQSLKDTFFFKREISLAYSSA